MGARKIEALDENAIQATAEPCAYCGEPIKWGVTTKKRRVMLALDDGMTPRHDAEGRYVLHAATCERTTEAPWQCGSIRDILAKLYERGTEGRRVNLSDEEALCLLYHYEAKPLPAVVYETKKASSAPRVMPRGWRVVAGGRAA